ncbi:hypothetical protein [Streptomyces sp. NPDC006997]
MDFAGAAASRHQDSERWADGATAGTGTTALAGRSVPRARIAIREPT